MLWTQNNFSKGELSPYMYSRADMRQYYEGLKTAQNILITATGSARKRFGTYYRGLATNITNIDDISFEAFHYLNECVYQLIFRAGNIDIYLEGILIITVGSTGMDAYDCANLDYTILGNTFRVTVEGRTFRPHDLRRSAGTPNVINGLSGSNITLTTAVTSGLILPVRFTVGATGLTSNPQVKDDVTYFARYISTSIAEIYLSSVDALNQANKIEFSSAGTAAELIEQNTWAFTPVTFKNFPVYDFNDVDYSGFTFTPSAIYGSTTLTSSTPMFETKHVGGAFFGGGGIARITNTAGVPGTPSTTCTINIIQPFTGDLNVPPAAVAIPGRIAIVTEPAWSNARGWPQKCSSFQSRSIFANTQSLPNGFWASSTNDYNNFNDLETDDDDAISYYPTSDTVNYINFIVPYRSLTVHTNSGVFSSPTAFEQAMTPDSFSLYLQDITPATVVQPRAIDNQIIVISGNDVHSMIWDGSNNAYQSAIISIFNEQLIRDPVDEAAYSDLTRAGSRYVFVVNRNGSMAILQTLISQQISGWSPATFTQSYGESAFRRVITDFTGRSWFLTQRDVPTSGTTANVTGVDVLDNTILELDANLINDGEYGLIKFTGSDLPDTVPPLVADEWYWARHADTNDLYIYENQANAIADENALSFNDSGTSATVTVWTLSSTFMIEELTWDTYLDCATYYNGSATDTVSGLSRFNGLEVKMVGDGFGFEAVGNNDEVVFEAHGLPVDVEEAYIGFAIETVIETLPLALGQSTNVSNLTRPTHIRNANFMLKDTIGGMIDNVPIALTTFNQVIPGDPPEPRSGVFEVSLMKGWDDFTNPSFTITHNEPFNFELLGIFYNVDV